MKMVFPLGEVLYLHTVPANRLLCFQLAILSIAPGAFFIIDRCPFWLMKLEPERTLRC